MIDKAKNFLANNKKVSVLIFIAVLLVITSLFGYQKGYRIKNNFGIGKVGTVFVETRFPNTSIFIDESEQITTTKENEVTSITFSPRRHSIIVSGEGFYPWKKDFTVPSGGELILRPVFVAQSPSGLIITKRDPEYTQIRNNIIKSIVPSKGIPKASEDGSALLWLEDNAVMLELARENSSTTPRVSKIVIQPDTVVKNVDFYKDRSDVIIFSTTNAIYAIDSDSTGGQNFLPIYKGQDPNFVRNNDDSIYVLDGENLMEIYI
jgi:hypothetical protein